VAPLLEGRFHIVAVDFRGHGGREHMTPPAYHFDDYVADVIAALDVLGWPKPLVVGHSMGAYVGATLAALPRVECPTLVVHGEGSVVMSRAAAERVAATVKRGTCAELKNTWHHLILDDPAGFAGAVARWLAHIHKEDPR
jgi:pimeloyl-ACP methyl ester carboxylesterase